MKIGPVAPSRPRHEQEVSQVKTKITIDSAAEESVSIQMADNPLKLVNASGGRIEHFGGRVVSFNPESCDGRPLEGDQRQESLMTVARVVDAGNVVHFGPRNEDNFIMNVGFNDKVCLHRKGNSYALTAEQRLCTS